MGKKKQKDVVPAEAPATEASETTVAVERGAEPQPVEPESEAPKKKGRKATGEMTLADLADRYLVHLEKEGKSNGTCFSYRLELQTALGELGEDTIVGNLTPAKVGKYFDSDRVTKKRNGKKKSPLSIAKTCRVLRMALEWAAEKGWIQFVWVSESEATH